jgi:hypothetical protein
MRRKVTGLDAGQVAGLLVLLGVVGALTAIVGSGIEAGPVKFPSIPTSRQKPLALASVVVVIGGVTWWAIQQHSGTGGNAKTTTGGTGPAASGKLRVSLIPARSSIRVGERLSVRAEVYDSLGQQLGSGQCELTWTDRVSRWTATTGCLATASEPSVLQAGVHHVAVKAQGLGGLLATGSGAVAVTVQP